MSKHEPRAPLAPSGGPPIPDRVRASGSSSTAARSLAVGQIGFIGLGHMGAAMAANLAASGRRVIAYVRRRDQLDRLEALGLRPTTDIADLIDCEVVITMLPDEIGRAHV